MVEALAFLALRFPGAMQFDNFAFFDTGANLTAQYLLSHGYSPIVDFAYHYGLLPLLFGHFWFGTFGATPQVCEAAVLMADVLIVWGLVRFVQNLCLNIGGLCVLALTVPFIVPYSCLNIAHLIEPVLLCHAFAEQARGKRRSALVLATVCIFVKPSMAYVYGAVLVAEIVAKWLSNGESGLRDLVVELLPASVAGMLTVVILAIYFGPATLVRSLVPSEGARMYAAQHFGFIHGSGRLFWAPAHNPPSYYVTTIAGPWLIATVVLAVGSCFSVIQLLGAPVPSEIHDSSAEIVVTSLILHVTYIFFFFGNEFSWQYYLYILVFGLAALAQLGFGWTYLVAFLALAFPAVKVDKFFIQRTTTVSHHVADRGISSQSEGVSGSAEPGFTYNLWITSSPNSETAGLWAPDQERAEWIKVRSLIRRHRTGVLDRFGCAELLIPGFDPPVTLYLVPGGPNERMVARKVSQLASMSMVVMPRWQSGLLDEWPEIGSLLRRNFVIRWQGSFFIVYSRPT